MLLNFVCLIALCDTPALPGQLMAKVIDPSFNTAAEVHYRMYGLLHSWLTAHRCYPTQ